MRAGLPLLPAWVNTSAAAPRHPPLDSPSTPELTVSSSSRMSSDNCTNIAPHACNSTGETPKPFMASPASIYADPAQQYSNTNRSCPNLFRPINKKELGGCFKIGVSGPTGLGQINTSYPKLGSVTQLYSVGLAGSGVQATWTRTVCSLLDKHGSCAEHGAAQHGDSGQRRGGHGRRYHCSSRSRSKQGFPPPEYTAPSSPPSALRLAFSVALTGRGRRHESPYTVVLNLLIWD